MRTQAAPWHRLGLLLFCLLVSFCERNAPIDHGYAGTWTVSLNHQTFFVLTLKQQAGAFAGSLSWPEHWSTSTGASFSGVAPQILTRTFSTVSSAGQALHLTITDPANKDDSDEFDLSLIDDDHASLAWTGVPFPPWSMVRSRDPKVAVAKNWDPKFVYRLEAPPELPNAQMAAIFDDDQKARLAMPNTAGEWAPIEKADAQRRVRTRALLESGQLKAGQDYRKAAFVFQHGDQPDDFLFAHTLALVALAKGDIEARWIATATLDRYLNVIGKSQIYGTGFRFKNGKAIAEERFNRTLISDDLRKALGVPPLDEQLDQFKAAMHTTADGKVTAF